jgi:hypothetical protein
LLGRLLLPLLLLQLLRVVDGVDKRKQEKIDREGESEGENV